MTMKPTGSFEPPSTSPTNSPTVKPTLAPSTLPSMLYDTSLPTSPSENPSARPSFSSAPSQSKGTAPTKVPINVGGETKSPTEKPASFSPSRATITTEPPSALPSKYSHSGGNSTMAPTQAPSRIDSLEFPTKNPMKQTNITLHPSRSPIPPGGDTETHVSSSNQFYTSSILQKGFNFHFPIRDQVIAKNQATNFVRMGTGIARLVNVFAIQDGVTAKMEHAL